MDFQHLFSSSGLIAIGGYVDFPLLTMVAALVYRGVLATTPGNTVDLLQEFVHIGDNQLVLPWLNDQIPVDCNRLTAG